MSHRTLSGWFIDQPIVISHVQHLVKMIDAKQNGQSIDVETKVKLFCDFDGDMLSYVKLWVCNTGH